MRQVLRLRGQDPVWDTSSLCLRGQDRGWDFLSFAASLSRSLLGYLKFCGFALKIPMGNLKFVASRSARLGYILQVCGFAVRIPVGILQVLWLRGQDPDWDARSLWLRGLGPGWNTSSFEENPSWDTSRFVASQSRSRLGYLKFVVRGQDPG